MPSLSTAHHVSLTVADADASAGWYQSVLGLVEVFREMDGGRRAVILRVDGGDLSVGLAQHDPSRGPFDPTTLGLDHFAFTAASSEELDEWAARFEELGVTHSGVIDVPPGRILNFKDPDGIALALFWDRPS